MRLNGDLVPDNCRTCGVMIAVHPRRIGSPNYCPVHKEERRKASMRAASKALYEKKRGPVEVKRCVDCGAPVDTKGNQHETRCPEHAAERKREAARDRQRKRSDLQKELASDPGTGFFRWRIAKCACGRSFVRKSPPQIRCHDCSAEQKRASTRKSDESVRGKYLRSKADCPTCGLPYRPKPGDDPECAVCLHEKAKAAGGSTKKLTWHAASLRDARMKSLVAKPPPGSCFVCGSPSSTWYCSPEHMRTGYKILIEEMRERRDLASAFETETSGPVWDPTLGHKGAYRPNRKRRRRRRRARVYF